MKPILLAIFKTALVICLLSAGQSYADSNRLIVSDTTFTPDATIDAEGVEKGAINGVSYQFYLNGGFGSFAGVLGGEAGLLSEGTWRIQCDKDAITDEKSCSMSKNDLFIFIEDNGQTSVGIGSGSKHYPFTPVTIRIDEGKPITSPDLKDSIFFSPTVSKKIVKRLKTAKHVTTRCVTWPYNTYDDSEWDVYGFNESLQFVYWALKHIK